MDSNYVLHKKKSYSILCEPTDLRCYVVCFSLFFSSLCVCVSVCVCVCVCALVPGIFTDLFLHSLNHYC